LHELFLPSYIFQNLYNYVLNPFLVKPPFPFLYPIRGRIEAILPWQLLPELYTAQAITGFLFGVPFLIYSILPVAQLVKQLFYSEQTSNTVQNSGELSLLWITTSLFGSFLLPFLSLLAFFWAAMRYSEDFMPALVVLSIIGFWEGWESRSRSSNEGRIYAALGGLLAVASIILAVFLALAILHTNGLLG
jgi:drug/metabolite transporter superfamily protein YnfA